MEEVLPAAAEGTEDLNIRETLLLIGHAGCLHQVNDEHVARLPQLAHGS